MRATVHGIWIWNFLTQPGWSAQSCAVVCGMAEKDLGRRTVDSVYGMFNHGNDALCNELVKSTTDDEENHTPPRSAFKFTTIKILDDRGMRALTADQLVTYVSWIFLITLPLSHYSFGFRRLKISCVTAGA